LINKLNEDHNEIKLIDSIKLNHNFQNINRRLKLATHGKIEEIIKKGQFKLKSEKIEDDRSHAIEATIVRVMKGAQKLHHNDLVNKVLTQLENFKIQISVSDTI
jgi:hypothetical protein